MQPLAQVINNYSEVLHDTFVSMYENEISELPGYVKSDRYSEFERFILQRKAAIKSGVSPAQQSDLIRQSMFSTLGEMTQPDTADPDQRKRCVIS